MFWSFCSVNVTSRKKFLRYSQAASKLSPLSCSAQKTILLSTPLHVQMIGPLAWTIRAVLILFSGIKAVQDGLTALFRTAVHLLDFIYACIWLRCLELRSRSHPRQDPHGHKRSIGFPSICCTKSAAAGCAIGSSVRPATKRWNANLVRGFEYSKGEYARLTDAELETIEAEANRSIDLKEFVPILKVDPIYFESSYYLGPDEGGEKPYRLLAEALAKTQRAAVAELVSRGKEQTSSSGRISAVSCCMGSTTRTK